MKVNVLAVVLLYKGEFKLHLLRPTSQYHDLHETVWHAKVAI